MRTAGRRRARHRAAGAFRRPRRHQSVAICGQCHAQSAVHDAAASGEVNFGVRGPMYRTYPTTSCRVFRAVRFIRDGRFRATTFISEAFARSQCFQTGGATCASCHDSHPPDAATNPTSLKFGEDDDRMCLQCHTSSRTHPSAHPPRRRHRSQPLRHLPHAPHRRGAVFEARSHQIDEIPDAAMTARFGAEDSPNACLSCHGDPGLEWLTAAMAARQH